MKFVISYSGGKDSALALYRMILQGHEPVAFITTINAEQNRSWFHGIPFDLLGSVAESLRIPLIPCACKPGDYTAAFEESLCKAKSMGAEACAFGDIDIEDHRKWNEERCLKAGLRCVLPLWQQGREVLTRETIAAGFSAMIKLIRCDVLDDSFLGQTLSLELIEKIKESGSDVCGENGEYHTFVYGGPIFHGAVPIVTGEIIDFGTHRAIDIRHA